MTLYKYFLLHYDTTQTGGASIYTSSLNDLNRELESGWRPLREIPDYSRESGKRMIPVLLIKET